MDGRYDGDVGHSETLRPKWLNTNIEKINVQCLTKKDGNTRQSVVYCSSL